MSRFIVVLAALLVLGGCSKSSQNSSSYAGGENALAEAKSSAPAEAGNAGKAKLAYSHNLGLEMPATSVKPRYERARDFCLNNAQLNCTVINASLFIGDPSSDELPRASLMVRVPHESVSSFEDSLFAPLPDEKPGAAIIRNHSMKADDLTKAITDLEQRQKQLMDYRDRLSALAKRADAKVEDLVKIESELSETQSQLEAIDAQKKGLDERVATETLAVDFMSQPNMGNSLAPVIQAWHQGGRVLGSSAGEALRFAISSLPWLPVIAIGLLFVRLFFRRWRRVFLPKCDGPGKRDDS
jgi:hypothetical protein